MENIKNLRKEEIVEFYNNKTNWTVEEVEAFENKLLEVYNEDSAFVDGILGFNDSGYGKYTVMSDSISDWGLGDIFNNKNYSSHDIVDLTRDNKTKINPFVKECKDFCIVDEKGLLEQFKKIIKIK